MDVYVNISDDIILNDDYIELIASVINQGMADEGVEDSEVSVLITGDEEIQLLNRRHRGVDKPTDVLSFPLCGSNIQAEFQYDNCLGDIVISLPRATSQAGNFGHSLRRELAFLTAHGLMHLLGYDHETSSQDEQVMIGKQEALLTKLGILR